MKILLTTISRKLKYLLRNYFKSRLTSLLPTNTALPHTRPHRRVSLRNCCHRRHIPLYAKSPYSTKTVHPAQHAQTAPLSQIPRFTPLSLTSQPRTQRASYAGTYQTAEYRSLCTFSLAFSDPLPA